MFNAYAVILILFILAGLIATVWGAWLIARGRKSLDWPSVEGMIHKSEISAEHDDLLPDIRYRYCVGEQELEGAVTFPGGTTPSQQLSQSYARRYPEGKTVTVYYDPADPRTTTLEPGPANGDWLVSAIGVIMMVLGIVWLLI